MASNPPSQCCTVGVKHGGEPLGKLVKVARKWDAYLATPHPGSAHEGAGILFCPDAMGIWQNSKLMADQFAASGYLCLVIDLYNGDPLALNKPAGFDFAAWMHEGSDGNNPHTTEAIDPIVVAAVEAMRREYGITKLGAVGYCFGAKYAVRHYKSGIQVGFIAHPTFVSEEELGEISGPLSIAAAETDEVFPAPLRHKSEEILQGTGHPYQVNLYSGVAHGYAVRGSPEIKVERFAKENAFAQAVTWFNEWLL
ncbi:related to hydrolase related to dienelactone hydrolase [Cephalotrichum gorgonifer]|uniref:Related to hydrolase related to dienelactone hydrolase n=1 Tax=Cephalotrichum gorgonifer TaxID=2041049 RepID=A0AAE8MT42_9PEZI|nr:related to hydrolase related to dienelactone hydrolase [Cephalotrichum gorgonifer]